MSGILNDQATAERLVGRLGGNARYIPGHAGWFVRRGTDWGRLNAEAVVREELVSMLAEIEEEGTRREVYERARQTLAAAQKAVLWILERDTRLLGEPEEIERPLLSSVSWEPEEPFLSIARAYFPEKPELLVSFSTHARMRRSTGPRILVRTTRQAADPADLFALFSEYWQDRVVQLPVKLWSSWPERLTPEWVHRLWGCWLVFLDAPEADGRRIFPQEALRRLLRPHQEWLGHDNVFRQLPMPTHYVLGGAPVNPHNWSAELHAETLEVRPVFDNGGDNR